MTVDQKLPPQAASILRVISTGEDCNLLTIASLKKLLLDPPEASHSNQKKEKVLHHGGKTRPYAINAAKRQTANKTCNSSQAQKEDVLDAQTKLALATKILNSVLKALTDAIKSRTAHSCNGAPQGKPLDTTISEASNTVVRPGRPKKALQPISVNLVAKSSPNDVSSDGLDKNICPHPHRVQAECARIGLACLRHLQSQDNFRAKFAPLQLENAMSVLIAKLLAFDLEDLALKELRILRRRIGLLCWPMENRKSHGPDAASGTEHDKESVAGLLKYDVGDLTQPLTTLIVVSQIQCLKMLGSEGSVAAADAALEHLQMGIRYSPIDLIPLIIDSAPLADAKGGLKHYEQLLVALQRLVSRLMRQEKVPAHLSKNSWARVALQYRWLISRIQIIYWQKSGCNPDLEKELQQPLVRSIAIFRQYSHLDARSGYDIVRQGFESIMQTTESHHNAVKANMIDVVSVLADMAVDCQLFGDAERWISFNLEISRDTTAASIQQATLYCRLALLEFNRKKSDDEYQVNVKPLQSVISILTLDIHANQKQMNEFLLVCANLRKAASSFLQDRLQDFDPEQLPERSSVLGQCAQFFFSCIKFLRRYLETSSYASHDRSSFSQGEAQGTNVSQVALGMVHSVTTITRLCSNADTMVWRDLDTYLKDCTEICRTLESVNKTLKAPKQGDRLNSIFVNISQTYWYRFLHFNPSNRKDKENLKWLEYSVDVLRTRNNETRQSGQYLLKLERYASSLESEQDFSGSQRCLEEALRHGVDILVLEKAADRSLIQAIPMVMHADGENEIQLVSRILSAYPRVSSMLADGRNSSSKLYVDVESQPPYIRGLMLAHQFSSISSLLSKKRPSVISEEAASQLLTSTLDAYTKDEYPIQRCYVISKALHLHLLWPKSLNTDSVRKLMGEIKQESAAPAIAQIMERYASHLFSTCQIYAKLLSKSADSSEMTSFLGEWCNLVRAKVDHQSLAESVYDMSDWGSLLEILVSYMTLKSNESLKTAALFVLTSLHQATEAKDFEKWASSLVSFGRQYTKLGHSTHAGIILRKVEKLFECTNLSPQTRVRWILASAEHAYECGDSRKAVQFIAKAKEQISRESEFRVKAGSNSLRRDMLSLFADSMSLESKVAAEEGHTHRAMICARVSVSFYHKIWATSQRSLDNAGNKAETTLQDLTMSVAAMSMTSTKNEEKIAPKHSCLDSYHFWDLAPQIFHSLVQLSELLADSGLFLESQYFLEESARIAQAVDSPLLNASYLAIHARHCISAEQIEKGLRMHQEAERTLSSTKLDLQSLLPYHSLTQAWLCENDASAARTMSEMMLQKINTVSTTKARRDLVFDFDSSPSPIDLAKDTDRRGKTSKPRPGLKAKYQPRVPQPEMSSTFNLNQQTFNAADSIPSAIAKGETLRHLAEASIIEHRYSQAQQELTEAGSLPSRRKMTFLQALLNAKIQMSQSMAKAVGDPVLGILQESTMSCPGGMQPNHSQGQPLHFENFKHAARNSQKKLTVKKATSNKEKSWDSCLSLLFTARQGLENTLHMLKISASPSMVRSATDTLARIVLILSAASEVQAMAGIPQMLFYTLELDQMLPFYKENLALKTEAQTCEKRSVHEWCKESATDCLEGQQIEQCPDLPSFFSEHLDAMPSSWTVVSLKMSESQEHIWVSRYNAGRTPFVIRIPLHREKGFEDEVESFKFDDVKLEMTSIAREANTSAHTTADLSRKGGKTEWWTNRAALDARLRDLLLNIENIWFGGFRGIFSDGSDDRALLARFKQSFQNTLDKHLPSRTTKSGKTTNEGIVTLGDHILELFTGLGDPNSSDVDLDDQLLDLLYFVIDTLQVNGERNAYDEIDFDAIAVEVFDALVQYHQALSAQERPRTSQHMILILDKNLHFLPWESLPCLSGKSISRLPSMACLKRRILQMQSAADDRPGVIANADKGAYMLNPAGDLVNTQASLEGPLRTLEKWDGVIQREPNEKEMKDCLQNNEVFLYFGHGSGCQYIRPRTIKKLDRCAATLLMGCSSGVLNDAGDFEPYGTPISYMHAGCPALLATLWDVTDKDIDRFSVGVLEKWGLLKGQPQGSLSPKKKTTSQQKRKGKQREQEVDAKKESSDTQSLSGAVSQSRGRCFLRYLNGAAPVVYGVPVYISG